MKNLNKLVRGTNRLLDKGFILFLLILLLISTYGLFDAYETFEEAKLPKELEKICPESEEDKVDVMDLSNKFNGQIIGWIYIDDTNINYPVVKGADNDFYLTHNFKKEYANVGSIFLDFRNDGDFKNDFSILYGHNMKTKMMFGGLSKYSDKEYMKNHSTGILYTILGDYRIDVYGFAVIGAYSSLYNLDVYKTMNNKRVIDFIDKHIVTKTGLGLSKEDKLMMLSTCRGSDKENRSVLLVKLTKIEY